jgi:hypothetical protein
LLLAVTHNVNTTVYTNKATDNKMLLTMYKLPTACRKLLEGYGQQKMLDLYQLTGARSGAVG